MNLLYHIDLNDFISSSEFSEGLVVVAFVFIL